jgi:thiol-disulfide isomerase/thioredoxin
MSESLYSKTDPVIILDDSCFDGKKIKSASFKGQGALKAYATWCPHCRDKVECIKLMATECKNNNIDVKVYVLEADTNRQAGSILGVEGFPSFFKVDATGNIGPILDVGGIPDVLKAVCPTCKFSGSCFTK